MKCKELLGILQKLSSFVGGVGGSTAAIDALRQLVSVAPNATVAQLAKTLAKIQPQQKQQSSTLLDDASKFADFVVSTFAGMTTTVVIKDLSLLRDALRQHPRTNLQDLLSAMTVPGNTAIAKPDVREEVVRRHHAALEMALGDDAGFTLAYRALQDDGLVRTVEVVALAKRFASAATKTRAAALKKIWSRHQALMTSRAKAAATAGRIAG